MDPISKNVLDQIYLKNFIFQNMNIIFFLPEETGV